MRFERYIAQVAAQLFSQEDLLGKGTAASHPDQQRMESFILSDPVATLK